MKDTVKEQIGTRLRVKRESAGYTREEFGELCSLSPRFIANIELGESSFSLDTLITMCKILSCSSDEILFGDIQTNHVWDTLITQIQHIDIAYYNQVDSILRGVIEIIHKSTSTS